MINAGANQSFIGGGINNTNIGSLAAIPGGDQNVATNNSFAAGHRAKAVHTGAFVWADSQDTDFASTTTNQFNVRANGGVSFVTGGAGMTLDGQPVLANGSGFSIQQSASDAPDLIGGASGNLIDSGVQGSVIAGGGTTNFQGNSSSNRISADFSSIGGGSGNWIQASADHSVIGNGWNNVITAGSYQTVIAGGQNNLVTSAPYAVIGGGIQNTNAATWGTIGGGMNNAIISLNNSTIGGGADNLIYSDSSTVSGGNHNSISPTANYSVIAGGHNNSISGAQSTISGGVGNIAAGTSSVVGGGLSNTNNGYYATIPGGRFNFASGLYSFAAGQQAQAMHQGAFVWADSQSTGFSSTANDQFLILAHGGVGINKNNPGTALDVNGTVTATSFTSSGVSPANFNAGVRLNDSNIWLRAGTDVNHGLG